VGDYFSQLCVIASIISAHKPCAKTGPAPPTSSYFSSRRVLGLGGLAHLNVSLTRRYTGLLFLTLTIILIVFIICSAPGPAPPDYIDFWPSVVCVLTEDADDTKDSTSKLPLDFCLSALYFLRHACSVCTAKPATPTYLCLRLHPGHASLCWRQRHHALPSNGLVDAQMASIRHRLAPHLTVPVTGLREGECCCEVPVHEPVLESSCSMVDRARLARVITRTRRLGNGGSRKLNVGESVHALLY